ncbi:MAG: phosphate ABC transporter substrate-binding protein [Oscillibacter sp.]|nr:phosphate ABC transporter substrate-binding protein [Oscillibacter sp.]
MKKIIALALAAALVTLAGCGAKDDPAASAPAAQTIRGTVTLDGSTSMEKVVGILIESFNEIYPDVTISYNGSGSGAGITAAIDGTCDMGLSSRELKDEETAKGAVAHVVALDGVAVVVNPENTVEDLTVAQIADIFSGKVTNWGELGGADGPIAVLGREPGSGTRGAFEEIVGVEDACVYNAEYSSTGDVIGQVSTNPNAIGYASLSAVSESVKAVKVEGVACTEATVKDGSFPIQRPFLMVTKEGAELSDAAQAFLDYAKSAQVADLIAQAGAVSPN